MDEPGLPSGTVTFLFTDIEGSTRLLKQLRDEYARVLAEHQELLRAAFAGHGGRLVDTQGDSFFVAFRRAQDAVEAAVDGQRSLQAHAWPEGVEVRVRMGIHTGQAEVSDGRYHGLAVHRAARIGAAGHGGQVLVSQTTRDLLDDEEEESAGVSLRNLGEQRLKDLDRPVRLYQLEAEGLPRAFPPLRTLAPEPQDKPAAPTGRRGWRSWPLVAAGALVAVGVVVVLLAVMRGRSGSGPPTSVSADSVGVFRAGNGHPLAQVSVQTRPNSVARGAGSIWVTNTDDNSVSRINPATKAVVETIPVGSGPAGVAVGDGSVWVANSGAGTVSKIDPRANSGSGAVVGEPIPVGNDPTGVAYGLGRVWVANAADATVTPIDPRSGAPGKAIAVGTGADGIATGDGAVWVTSEAFGTVTRIDPRTGTQQPIPVGSGPTAVAYGAGSVWVANTEGGTVSRIDPATNLPTPILVGEGPSAVSVSGNVVWVSNELAGTLSRIDPSQNKVVQAVTTGNRPQGLTVAANTMYVAVRSSGRAHRGGTVTEAVTAPTKMGLVPETNVANPQLAYDDWRVLEFTNDGLVGFRRVGGVDGAQVVPDLATAIPQPSNGGTAYTFQLRPGIRYSTGQLVQAADFRRALEQTLATNTPNVPQYYGDIVGASTCLKSPKHCDLSKGIVTDPETNTVTFNLTRPDPDFLYKLALPMADALPTHIARDAHRPATGPYMIGSYDRQHAIRLVRNPRFHVWSEAAQPDGYPDAIVFRVFKSHDAAVRAVERQQADVTDAGVFALSVAERFALLNGHYASQLHSDPGTGTGFIALNTRVPPFNDIRVRRAINYAVDRNKALIRDGGPTVSQPACHVLPPNSPGYQPYCPYTLDPNPAGTYNGPDLAKARRLVAESGTRGQSVRLLIATCCTKLAPVDVIAALRELGYHARLWVSDTLYPKAGDSRLKAQAIAAFWGVDFPSAANFFNVNLTCASFVPRSVNSTNWAEFCDPHIDAEVARASTLQPTDPHAASLLWTKADHDVTKQAPWVFLSNPKAFSFVSARVRNYQYNPVWTVLLDQLWVH